MKKFQISTFFIMAFISVNIQAGSGKGAISGVINHCDRGGLAGMMVYIPGKPHLVITASNGRFMLDNVAPGEHTLYFMVNGRIMNFNKWVEVSAGDTSKLGEISFCDKLTASMPANKTGVTTATTTTEPDMPVVTDGDCSNHPDGTSANVSNGSGQCQNGKLVVRSCNEGFGDCDKRSANGCETDILFNDEHCGACYNACSDLDTCQQGIC